MSDLLRITERYRLDKLIHASDAASVFRAVDLRSGQTVALKLIRGDIDESRRDGRAQFDSAAQALQECRHSSLPHVLDHGFTATGGAFLVAEYLQGANFELFAGSPVGRVLPLLLPVLDGLEELERHQLAHRNLRAGNLLVVAAGDEERLVVLGWGTTSAIAGEEGRRADLRGFAEVTCAAIGAEIRHEPSVAVVMPAAAAGDPIADAPELAMLLSLLLQPGTAAPAGLYAELRRAFRQALLGDPRPAVRRQGRQGGASAAATQASPAAPPVPKTPQIPETPEVVDLDQTRAVAADVTIAVPRDRLLGALDKMSAAGIATAGAAAAAGSAAPGNAGDVATPASAAPGGAGVVATPASATPGGAGDVATPAGATAAGAELRLVSGPALPFHATAAVRGDTLPVFRPEDLRGPATGTAPAETSPAGAPGPLPAATPGAEVGGPEPVPPPAPPLWPAAVTPLRPAHRRATGAARLSSPASPLHAAVAADPIAAAEERPTSTLDNSPDAAAKEAKAGEAPSALRDDESATAAGVAAGAVPASLFGTTPAAPATVSVFGTMPAAPAAASVFGTMPAAPAAASVFGTMPAAPAAASVFGTMPAAPAAASVFGTMPAAPGAAAARATVAAGARPQPGEIHGRAGRGRRRFAAAAAAGIGIAALAAAVVLLRHPGGERRAAPAAHRRAAAAGALSAAAPRPVAGPTAARPAGTTAPAGGQPALGPHLKAAEDLLAGGDAASARRELALVSAQEQAAFSPEARATYDRLAAALAADRRRQIGADLASALRRGDMRRISAALTAAKWEPDLPAATRRDLDRARQAIDLDARLARSDLGQAPQEALRNATDLLTLVPRHRRAGELRDQAAKAIEDQADAALAGGDGQRAAALLDGLRQAWPDRSGLKDRFDRLEAQRRNDGQLESVLAAASRAEAASQPLQGLELLAGVNPGGRYRERFRRQRERLEALLARLDAAPPSITLRPGFKLEYDKGARIAVPLRITDDLAVKSAEAWVRPEGATSYQAVPVRHLSGADYEVDIPPELHQNRGVELYAAAGDNSGHKSLLGSREQPLKLKRRTWIEKLFTGKEGARPEGGAGGGTGPTGSSGTGLTGFL